MVKIKNNKEILSKSPRNKPGKNRNMEKIYKNIIYRGQNSNSI